MDIPLTVVYVDPDPAYCADAAHTLSNRKDILLVPALSIANIEAYFMEGSVDIWIFDVGLLDTGSHNGFLSRLVARWPKAGIVLVSEKTIKSADHPRHAVALRKPFTMNDLVSAITIALLRMPS